MLKGSGSGSLPPVAAWKHSSTCPFDDFRDGVFVGMLGQYDIQDGNTEMKKIGQKVDSPGISGFVFKQNQTVGPFLQYRFGFFERVRVFQFSRKAGFAPGPESRVSGKSLPLSCLAARREGGQRRVLRRLARNCSLMVTIGTWRDLPQRISVHRIRNFWNSKNGQRVRLGTAGGPLLRHLRRRFDLPFRQ